jgi:hypothetical protein
MMDKRLKMGSFRWTKSLSLRGFPQGKPWQSHKEKISFLYIAHNDKKEIATPER